jgi:hypothetical protein
LENHKLELRSIQSKGKKVLADAAALQHLRLAESRLGKISKKLDEARKLQATYKALLLQLSKDSIRATGQLNQVTASLNKADTETAKLHTQLEAESQKREVGMAQLEALRTKLVEHRACHDRSRLAKQATVDKLAKETQLLASEVCLK